MKNQYGCEQTLPCFVDDFIDHYMQALTAGKPIVVVGDLNCILLTSCYESRALKDLHHSLNMGQLITEPTRVTPASQSLIDAISNDFQPSISRR